MKIIPFMKWRLFAAAFSLVAMIVAAGSLGTRSLNWGLDFTGGTLVEVTYGDSADLSQIRSTLENNGYAGAVVVAFGTDRDVLVRLPLGYSDDEGVAMVALLESSSAVPVELQRIEFVGPRWAKSSVNRAVWRCCWRWGWSRCTWRSGFQLKFARGRGGCSACA